MICPILDLGRCETAPVIRSVEPVMNKDASHPTKLRFVWSDPVVEPFVQLYMREFSKLSHCRIRARNRYEGQDAPRTGLDGLEITCPESWQREVMQALELTTERVNPMWEAVLDQANAKHLEDERANFEQVQKIQQL